ncbi:MAG: hypothetical protein IPP35_03975 [Elusimicrobia bacterium]|nr:hypothetical protein [Elusimicrobiota bacterium]
MSKKTLWRFGRARYLPLVRGRRTGRLYALREHLLELPVYPLGRAARLIGVHYETIRQWIKRGKISAREIKFTRFGRGWRRVSIREIIRVSEKKGKRA